LIEYTTRYITGEAAVQIFLILITNKFLPGFSTQKVYLSPEAAVNIPSGQNLLYNTRI
jgi:hypothetical membrane protein